MSRLTQSGYQVIHDHLFQMWRHDPDEFQVLAASERWALQDFLPPDVGMTDADLVAYRKVATQQYPSLPQRAGKAFNQLLRGLDAADARREARSLSAADGRRKKSTNKHRQLSVQGVVHAVPDQAKVARAIIQVAKDTRRAKESDRPDDQAA